MRAAQHEERRNHQPRPVGMADVMQRNISTVLERRQADETKKPLQLRIADAITRFTGSMRFVYIHLVLFASWILCNVPATPFPKFDPTFVVLAMFASVEAIFLSTFVLISQNRMAAQADKRADLDLHVSLLAEHEITRIVTLVKQIAEKLEIHESQNPELDELEKDVRPEKVLDALEEHQRRIER
jgi:uncharacterized membrane protein